MRGKRDDPAWVSKYLMDLWLMDKENWDKEGLVTEIAVIDIDEDILSEMKQAGSNPYVVLGLLNPEENTSCSKNEICGVGNLVSKSKA